MQSRQDLEKRVKELEARLSQQATGGYRGVRYRSPFELLGVPFVAIATGPDPGKGEMRGHARGIVAIGDMATGVLAIGGLARGIVAVGGLALGAFTFGGASIGAAIAFGGLAIGSVAVGGGAVGWTALGGGAVGQYACGGGALGEHVIDATRADPEAVAHFERYGVGSFCTPPFRKRRAT